MIENIFKIYILEIQLGFDIFLDNYGKKFESTIQLFSKSWLRLVSISLPFNKTLTTLVFPIVNMNLLFATHCLISSVPIR